MCGDPGSSCTNGIFAGSTHEALIEAETQGSTRIKACGGATCRGPFSFDAGALPIRYLYNVDAARAMCAFVCNQREAHEGG